MEEQSFSSYLDVEEISEEYKRILQADRLSFFEEDRVSEILCLASSDRRLFALISKIEDESIEACQFSDSYLQKQEEKVLGYLDAIDKQIHDCGLSKFKNFNLSKSYEKMT